MIRRKSLSKPDKMRGIIFNWFKFNGNQKQFVFNTELKELVDKIKAANAAKDHKVAELT